MPIPESVLKAWTHQGAVATSAEIYRSITSSLNNYQYWPNGIKPIIYLQGSYRNDTNIWSESDVDIVVEMRQVYNQDLSQLPLDQQQLKFRNSTVNYDFNAYKQHVIQALVNNYGASNVEEGKKCIKMKSVSKRFPADVILCISYRRYKHYLGEKNQSYEEGVTFYLPSENRWIINYPKYHYSNCANKNGTILTRCGGRFKKVVRIFK